MSTLRIACTAIAKRIMAGRVNKAGESFIGKPVDVTSDCLIAVIDFIGRGEKKVVTENGLPAYEIEVRDVRTSGTEGAQAAPEEVRELIRLRTIVEVASKFDMTSMQPITENDACRRILALRTSTDQADTDTGSASQLAPSSALPSRPDYWNIDTTGAQFDALARRPGAGNEPPSGAGGGGTPCTCPQGARSVLCPKHGGQGMGGSGGGNA
jgi:hypothetical protein